jgi:hypothetical protein
MIKPRLVIFAAAHPNKIAERLSSERKLDQVADGYFSRFLVCNVKKKRISLSNANYFLYVFPFLLIFMIICFNKIKFLLLLVITKLKCFYALQK